MEPRQLTLEDVLRYVARHGPARGEDIGAALGYPWAAETIQRRLHSIGEGHESFLCASKAGWYTRASYENEDAAVAAFDKLGKADQLVACVLRTDGGAGDCPGCGERHGSGEPSECIRCGAAICAL